MRVRPVRLLAFVVLAWVVAAGALVVFASFDLQRGADEIEAARASFGPEDLATAAPAARLGRARVRFSSASSRLHHPLLAPARLLPVAGRQLRTVAAIAGTAHRVAEAGQRAAVDARTALDQGAPEPADRLVLLERMQGILARAEQALGDADLGPDEALFPAVRARRAQFAADLDEARGALRDGQAGVAALRDLLVGPRRYLVLAGNNAEMRAGSGAFLSVGLLETDGGRISLGEFEAAGDLTLPPPGPPMEPDLAALWGWAEPNREWRNLGMSPRFDATGALAAEMWEARTGTKVDGVLALDVATVQAVLEATGPVDVGGERVAAADVGPLLMRDQYVEAGAVLGGGQTERRERLGELASAAVGAVEAGNFDLAGLGSRLAEAAAGRHVLLWASDPAIQAGWVASGIAGDVPPDALLVALLNRGANKLDPFLSVTSTFSTERVGTATRIGVRVQIENRTPDGEIAYIAGPNPVTGTAYGDYVGILALTVPAAATDVRLGDLPLVAGGRDGDAKTAGASVRIARGATVVVDGTFTMPGRTGSVRLLPSARLLPNEWRRTGTEDFNDGLGRTLRW